jgi:hypothetical protein
MTNFCQFKGATTSKNDLFERKYFGPNYIYIYIVNFYNRILKITMTLKYLNKFPTTQLVYNQVWQYSYDDYHFYKIVKINK